MRTPQQYLVGFLGAGVALAGLSAVAPAASADVTAKIAAFPYVQEWTDGSLITANDDWSGVAGVEGYLGQDLTTTTGTDPRTIIAGASLVANDKDVVANALVNTTAGGVHEIDGNTIAIQGSGTADAPHVVFHLDLTGQPAPTFAFDAKDLDASADNAAQAIAVQYRIGASGDYTNLPAGYIADATDADAATRVTPVSVPLPAETADAASVFVRVLTTNAAGSDELVGIDNVSVSTEPVALAGNEPADITTYVDQPIAPVQLTATGGAAPYTWTSSALPAGLTLSTSGELTGTPTAVGTTEVTATVTDSATPTAATDDVVFTITVEEAPGLRPIAEIQGTDAPTSPLVGETVTTEGVVTAMYKDPSFSGTSGGFDGMYVQTAGTGGATDATPGASDAIFVFGAHAMPAGVQIGDSVEVTGEVSEFNGLTEITPGTGGVVELDSPLAAVTPREIAYPTTGTGREAQEGMLLAPTDTFTVSNVFNANTFAEIGLATGDTPLRQPSDVAAPGTPEIQAVKDDNAARAVALDDGTSLNYMTHNDAKHQPLPWLSPANPIRVGAEATLTGPVVLDFRNNTWKFQPTSPVFDDGAGAATFEDTRAANMTPAAVPGDLKLATFNVLNYFNTTGEAYEAAGPVQNPPVNTDCTFFTDRNGTPIANNTCGVVTNGTNNGAGPRGAATQASFERQQAKIVNAINGLGADIVTLEELENSIKLVGETNRDDAIAALVDALNAAAGPDTWEYVPSPNEALGAANVAEQDVIRNGFIYKPATVELVGPSDLLFGTTAFANAREPLAQAFKRAGAGDEMAFVVIVNHFKSKSNSTPPATGDNANDPDTGAFNGDRVRQAQALVTFADQFAAARRTDKVFLTGDFNAYTFEEPMAVLADAGYTVVESDDAEDESYSFSGLSGSLDHVLANEAATATVQGADIWEINADEAIAFQYSRYNYNVTDFWQPNLPFAASDHNPEIVGINPAPSAELPEQIQILGTNDFHGRLLPNGGEAGAAVLAGVVKDLRAQNPNTVFSAAGDLIGASTFESFIQKDEPTIDALNEAGLEVSAAGNHEFDQGYEDFVGRVQDRADWEYIAANVNEPTGRDDLAETWTQTFGDVQVGFVGAVTEDLPSLVSPAGIPGVTVADIVESTNAAAADLKTAGADIVILLVHEGSPSTDCASSNFTDDSTVWGNITQNTSADVDAIISGHTHLAYNCKFPVAEWAGNAVTERPVVSAGQYGTNLNQLVFSVNPSTGELVDLDQAVLPIAGRAPADPATKAIVDDAVAEAQVLGAQQLGEVTDVFGRAKLPVPTSGTNPAAQENRGGESTLGNLVAEVQRWATETPEAGAAQIAFMNPGGLRADMDGTADGATPGLTYREAANVQPFANTLINMDLTGAQIETALEQQWQRTAAGTVPSRQFLRLGVSEGFEYTYVETPATVEGVQTRQGEVTGMWLDGVALDPTATYSVTVNSFLASGGDNFFEFANGTSRADTGKVDLQAMVDYMKQFAPRGTPLQVDYSQRAVEVEFPAEAPDVYAIGDQLTFDVASWAMSGRVNATDPVYDQQDQQISVQVDGQEIGTAAVDNTIGNAPFDSWGTASVSVTLPFDVPAGDVEVTLVGEDTGTEVVVPITVVDDRVEATVTGTDVTVKYGKATTMDVTVTADGAVPTGDVTLTSGDVELGTATLVDGTASVAIPARKLKPSATPYPVTISYSGDGSVQPTTGESTLTVTRGNAKLTRTIGPDRIRVDRTHVKVVATVTNIDGVPVAGKVTVSARGITAQTVRLVDGEATIRLPVFGTRGQKVLRIVYGGSALLLPDERQATIRVVR